jgi:hypothetical protein
MAYKAVCLRAKQANGLWFWVRNLWVSLFLQFRVQSFSAGFPGLERNFEEMEDGEFVAYHGYRCLLPDIRLFVERQPHSWMAVGYEIATKLTVMEQPVNDSTEGRAHCQVWVNSFRFPDPNAELLSKPLEWEVY